MGNYSNALRGARRYEEALPILVESLYGLEALLGVKAGEVVWTYGHLGKLYHLMNNSEQALKNLLMAVTGSEETMGPFHKSTVKNILFYAEVLLQQEMYAEAAKWLCRALITQRDVLKLTNKDVQKTTKQLADVLTEHLGGIGIDQYEREHYDGLRPPQPPPLSPQRSTAAGWLTPSETLRTKLTLRELAAAGKLKGQRVFLRLDLNVGLKDMKTPPFGRIKDATRIEVSLQSIRDCLEAGARRVVICSHLQRPKGREEWASLTTVAIKLGQMLGREVTFVSEGCVGEKVEAACEAAGEGAVILLENVRFHDEEDGGGEGAAAFRAGLARLGDVYINDAFATMHRAHASMLGEGFPVRAMGPLVEAELAAFTKLLDAPAKPIVAIVGGYKLDKIRELAPLTRHVNSMLVGGGIGSAFLKTSRGVEIGGEEFGPPRFPDAEADSKSVLRAAQERGVNVYLPSDWHVSYVSPFTKPGEATADGQPVTYAEVSKVVSVEEGVPAGKVSVTYTKSGEVQERQWKPFDVGPATIEAFTSVVQTAKTVYWNGPPGLYNCPASSAGSEALANAVCSAMKDGAQVLLGGGGTSELFRKFAPHAEAPRLHVCTGGGVSIELMAAKTLPALAALSKKL